MPPNKYLYIGSTITKDKLRILAAKSSRTMQAEVETLINMAFAARRCRLPQSEPEQGKPNEPADED